MNKITDWIKRHQITAFFILTFVITWGLGFSYGAVIRRSQYRLAPLVSLASCGPALAGIIISAVINTKPRQGAPITFWIVFFVTLVLSAAIHGAYLLLYGVFQYTLFNISLRLMIVLPVAFVIASVFSRIPEVREYLSTFFRFRGVWGWVLLALIIYPATVLLSVPISRTFGLQNIMANPPPKEGTAMVGWFGFKFIQSFLFFSAAGEAGWRGFALPRMQKRLNPLSAALIIAFFWVLWHIFKWRAEGQPVTSLQFWIEAANHVLMSIVLVWFYNRSKGSILVASVNYAAAATTGLFYAFQPQTGIHLVWVIIIVVMVLTDRMWQKLPGDHPAVYQSI